MSEIWIYLDESGTVDFEPTKSKSPYFAFGSASIRGSQARFLEESVLARASRDALAAGFHAYNDSPGTRQAFFDVLGRTDVRFASTFMAKSNAFPRVRERPKIWLYKYTLYVHLKAAIPRLSAPGDTVHVVAAHIDMGARQEAVWNALADVCAQFADKRDMRPHIWRSSSSAGLQMADYALWAIQRSVVQGKDCHHLEQVVLPRQEFRHFPWAADVSLLAFAKQVR